MQNVIDWASSRTFSVWKYGIGHSQLLLASQETATETGLGVHFEAVEYMRLIRTFKNLRITTADEQHIHEVETSGTLAHALRPLLVLALHHDHGVGLIACSRLRIGQFHGEPTSNFDTLQLHSTATR
ncbi:hypothetical protein ACFXA3_01905 [Streptomyces sp. NPDC059456]|uniref:hypothetical protein n=1 Tax=Streptomyces sp. NPDC059456 TaxID=3346838 RepID=UPI00367A9406